MQALGDKHHVLVLRNHGIAVCERDIPTTFMLLWTVQRAAEVQCQSDRRCEGDKHQPSDDDGQRALPCSLGGSCRRCTRGAAWCGTRACGACAPALPKDSTKAPRTHETGHPPEGVFVQEIHLGANGLRVGIKDCIDIAGYPTRAGSAALANATRATRHATVVQSLLDGGCRLVGKTTLHELAYGVTGINPWSGTPLNPRFPDRVPGGSSSGSAVAVAAERVDFALGTDTGGSIRLPAACCGVYGLKPTYGRLSRVGVQPPTSSLDCVGPLARDLDMLERAMALLDPTFTAETAPRHRAHRLRLAVSTPNPPSIEAARRRMRRHRRQSIATPCR